jgi:hypothetical protein
MLPETVCSCPLPTPLHTKRQLKPVSILVHFGVRVLNCGWTDTEHQRRITIIGSTALGEPWRPQANVASDLYPGHLPANFYNPVSLRLLIPHQSILLSLLHVLVVLQDLSITSFWIIRRQLMMIGGGGERKFSEKTLSLPQSARHKSHTDYNGSGPNPRRWAVGNKTAQIWRAHHPQQRAECRTHPSVE